MRKTVSCKEKKRQTSGDEIVFDGFAFFEGVEDFIDLVFGHAAIPIVVGLDDNDRTLTAYTETGGGGNNGVDTAVGTLFADVLQERYCTLFVAVTLRISGNSVRVAYQNGEIRFLHLSLIL
jgi:hypothetical protein